MQHRYNDVARSYLLRLSQLQQQGCGYASNAPSPINLLNIMQQYESMLQQRNNQLLLGEILLRQNYNQKPVAAPVVYEAPPPPRFLLPHQPRYQQQSRQVDRTSQNKPPSSSYFVNNSDDKPACRPIRGVDVDSLYPHGESLVEKWSTEDYGRHGRWNYRENPTWRPAVQSRHGEYTGSDLIKARGEHELKSGYRGPRTFYENVRSLPWQMVPMRKPSTFKKNIPSRPWRLEDSAAEDPSSPFLHKSIVPSQLWQLESMAVQTPRSKNSARNLTGDYGKTSGDCSDSSSSKSGGSSVGYWSLSE